MKKKFKVVIEFPVKNNIKVDYCNCVKIALIGMMLKVISCKEIKK